MKALQTSVYVADHTEICHYKKTSILTFKHIQFFCKERIISSVIDHRGDIIALINII